MLGIEEDTSPAVPTIHFSANPSRGPVTISAGGDFSIIDMTGREVASGTGSETISGLETGIYLVRSENGHMAATAKLCIIN